MQTLKTKTTIKGLSKKTNLLLTIVVVMFNFIAQTVNATPISGIRTVGTGGNYPNLTAAFTDINLNGLSESLDLQLIAGYPASPETFPLEVSTPTATAGFQVHIYPMVAGLSITSANAFGTLNFNGSDNIIIDGRIGGTGLTINLTIANTNVGSSHAIRFIDDASSNLIEFCNVRSRNNNVLSGTIVIGGTNGPDGNDNNYILGCNIGDDGSGFYPVNAIYGSGSTTTTAKYNDNTLIYSNRIYNFFSATNPTNGIYVRDGNSGWDINGNHIYQTATRTYTAGNTHTGINVSTATGNNFNVRFNNVGGSDANTAGTAYTMTGNVQSLFRGIVVNVGSTVASNVQGNKVANISFSTTSQSFTNPGFFSGISVGSGLVNIGTVAGNTVGAPTGTGSIVVKTSSGFTGRVMCIHASSSANLQIQNNNVGSIQSNSGINGQIIYGIYVDGTGTHTITNNLIGSNTTANSISSGTAGVSGFACRVYGIYYDVTGPSMTISSNTIKNLTASSVATPLSTFIAGIISGTGPLYQVPITISNNVISDLKSTGADVNLHGIYVRGGNTTVSGNQISNLSLTNSSGTELSEIWGICDRGTISLYISNNEIYNFSIAGSGVNWATGITGIHIDNGGATKHVFNNTIHDFNYTNTSTGQVELIGITNQSSSDTINNNKIYNLTATNGANSVVWGIKHWSSGFLDDDIVVYNNLIGGLFAPAANPGAFVPAVAGLNIGRSSAGEIYNNTVNITGSGGANFGSAAFYMTAYDTTTTTITVKNNIFRNTCVASGTGKTVAFHLDTAVSLNEYTQYSDYNDFYAGTPGPDNLIFYDGTNADQTMNTYKIRVAESDQASFSKDPVFISTTGSSADFLHIDTTIPTYLEGGAIPVTVVTTDIDGNSRNANTPDIGADEFNGIGIPHVLLNSVATNVTGDQCTATSRTITANVTAGTTNLTAVVIKYSVDFGPILSSPMTGGNTAAGSTSDWTGTIPASGHSIVSWYVIAYDEVTARTKTGASYQDAPLTDYTTTASASLSTVCAGHPTNLSVILNKNFVTIGNGNATLGTTQGGGQSPFAQWYEAEHAQYLYTVADLIAAGLNAGNITALGFNVIQKNSSAPFTGYTIKLALTNLGSLTAFQANSFTQVYQSSTTINTGYSSVAGVNTFTFGIGAGSNAAFNWDGTSNILVDICYSNDQVGTDDFYTLTDIVAATAKSYTATYSRFSDNADLCGTTTGGSGNSNLPDITFTGNSSRPFSSVSWSDGTNIVGTISPLTVSPTITTTYTATLVDPVSNCPATSNTITVTVNQRPTAVISGDATYCPGAVTSTTLNIAVTGTGPWNGTLSDGAPFTGNTSPITVNVTPALTTTYTVATLTDNSCNSIPADFTGSATITINPAATTPTITAGGATTFCNGDSVILTSSASTGNQWNVNGSPINNENDQTLTVTTGGDYTVTVNNGNCSATSVITTVIVNTSLPTPAATVVQPTCAVATGRITVISPTGVGITYSVDGGAYQSSPIFNLIAPGVHLLSVQNSSGCSSSANITVDPQPTVPTPPVVTGITNICPYIGTNTQLTYSASSPGATSYTWSIPASVNLVSGAGTSSIVVTFPDPSIISQNYKQFKVRATSACGTSSQTIFYMLAQFPVTPAPITASSTDLCSIIGTSGTITYTIPKANSAISYLWVAQQGSTINHPNGAGVNDTIVTVSFDNSFSTSPITVSAVNDCGVSGTRSYTIIKGIPSTPSLISGPTNACSNVSPGTAATYSIAPVPGASNYNWTVPANAINLSGQGTNTISFTYPQGFTSGVISVTASNGCGTSGTRSLSVTTLTPSTPGAIDVVNIASCPNRIYSYSISNYPANASSLVWTIPAGAILVGGQNSPTITVSYPSTAVTGVVTVQSVSNCGSSATRSTQVKLPACPPSVPFAKANATSSLNEVSGIAINIYPNPTISDFKLQVISTQKEKMEVRIMDMQGRLFKQLNIQPYQTVNLGANLKGGIYLIEVRQGTFVKTTKLLKF